MFNMPSGWEWIVILILGLLLFGRRLPEVGRAFGKTIVEFKKGMAGIEDEVNAAANRQAQTQPPTPMGTLPPPTPVTPVGADNRVGTHESVER